MEQKNTKKQNATVLLSSCQGILQCPVCKKSLKVRSSGKLLCKKDHCFDVAKTGYVNLASSGALPGYDKALFQNRRTAFGLGFYDKVVDALRDIIAPRLVPGQPLFVLDAGCGEGFYTASLASDCRFSCCRFFGIDLSRDAVMLAAQRETTAGWLVADVANLPFSNSSFDVVLDILTPANYKEFRRILKKDGVVIKIVPGQNYLKELRDVSGQGMYTNRDVVDYAAAHMKLSETRNFCYTLPLSQGQAELIYGMTPLTSHTQPENLDTIAEITIDLQIITASF